MNPVLLVPEGAEARARAMARRAGWELRAGGEGAAVEAALVAGAGGEPVLFVPPGARVPRNLRRILVPHEGSPAATSGMEAADQLGDVCGAEILVLHVPQVEAALGPGGLPVPRVVDHPGYDWEAWRQEFERRFCRCTEGVRVSLEVAAGPAVGSILEAARRLRADLIVMSWKQDAGEGRAETLKAVAREAPCPLLIVTEAGTGSEAARPG